MTKLVGESGIWKVRRALWFKPASFLESAVRRYDEREIKRSYLTNLKWVLGFVRELAAEPSGKVVVSSDHGKCLGNAGSTVICSDDSETM